MFAQSADELARLHGFEQKPRRSTRTEIIRIEKQSGLDEFRSVFSGSRAASRRRDGMCRDAVRAGVRCRDGTVPCSGFYSSARFVCLA